MGTRHNSTSIIIVQCALPLPSVGCQAVMPSLTASRDSQPRSAPARGLSKEIPRDRAPLTHLPLEQSEAAWYCRRPNSGCAPMPRVAASHGLPLWPSKGYSHAAARRAVSGPPPSRSSAPPRKPSGADSFAPRDGAHRPRAPCRLATPCSALAPTFNRPSSRGFGIHAACSEAFM